ncbi:PQQ-binding-like beta-propeller repeat protein [Natronorubrum sp. JWXQ-INN-674]|uniref:PQQ-binding-like beta-propeller repeat protein n=1 Tax=Natronorubrum halalkaliphilum TaxID=2691917 RepID=A0A6B0VNT7_9EURY|nr:PQQ-binding-like beta-propeller repeat protein [Natronorubrum halalkaliphilum]MXV62895.1 PQQ-binding-like beta-propeller repeat protein [Natronorubrum halalkaliphilum]
MTDWNQFKGDPRHSGLRRDLDGPYRVTAAWTADLTGPVGSPVLDRDTVFVGTSHGNCYAYERDTGRRRWVFETMTATDTAPVVTHDHLYLATGDGTVHALDPATGDQRWTADLPGSIESALALSTGLLYAGHTGGLSALEPDTGEILWTAETEAAVVGSPAVDTARDRSRNQGWGQGRDGDDEQAVDLLSLEDAQMSDEQDGSHDQDRVYVGTDDETVLAFEAETGEELWDAPTDGTIVDGPTVVDGRVYVADDTGTLLALHADSGQSWFTYQIQDSFTSSATVLPDIGSTFVGASDGYLHVTDTTFGRRKLRGWLFSKKGVALDGPVRSSPVIAGDIVCVGDSTGSLYGIDVTDDCDLRWHFGLEGAITGTPALGDQQLYVGSDAEQLTCLEWELGEPKL